MNVLVTGATGFLGTALCSSLITQGFAVRGVGRNLQLARKLENRGVTFIQADLRRDREVADLCRGVDCVIHAAALSSPWGRRKDFIEANVDATRYLLHSALRHQVRSFVYISSSSLYFDFTDRYQVSEQAALATPFASFYSHSKYQAEQEVRRAASHSDLAIVILRPRGIFGPGDTSIIPRVLSAHKKGKLRIIGDGKNIVDLTYVDNVAHAAILALRCRERLEDPVFNITNDEPVGLWDLVNRILEGVGLARVTARIPYRLAYRLAYLSELASRTMLFGKEPMLTRYTAGLLAKSQTLDITKAKTVLGYSPVVKLAEGIENVIAWLNGSANEVDGGG